MIARAGMLQTRLQTLVTDARRSIAAHALARPPIHLTAVTLHKPFTARSIDRLNALLAAAHAQDATVHVYETASLASCAFVSPVRHPRQED